jgi:hypothetical protein
MWPQRWIRELGPYGDSRAATSGEETFTGDSASEFAGSMREEYDKGFGRLQAVIATPHCRALVQASRVRPRVTREYLHYHVDRQSRGGANRSRCSRVRR